MFESCVNQRLGSKLYNRVAFFSLLRKENKIYTLESTNEYLRKLGGKGEDEEENVWLSFGYCLTAEWSIFKRNIFWSTN